MTIVGTTGMDFRAKCCAISSSTGRSIRACVMTSKEALYQAACATLLLAVFLGDLSKLVQDRLTVPRVVSDDFDVLAALREPSRHENRHLVLAVHADVAPSDPRERSAVDRARPSEAVGVQLRRCLDVHMAVDEARQERAATAVYDNDLLLLRAAGRVRADGAVAVID
ncbi:hypothetical protein DL770_004624 [Monosporascus sp. CRB-9-2]|nr:hypothetical protein DL770_004624 [Monosporascus sp. CRB-9-2]